MIASVIRFIKRFFVLIPGLFMAYLAAKEVYPFLDRRIPTGFAVFVTYILTAYLLIPALMRLIRIFIKPKHIPLYCITPDGFASDPINIGLVGTKAQVIAVMQKAGWYLADKKTIGSMFRMGLAIISSRSYPNAPLSSLYLFGRRQDLGFELPLDDNPKHRHHVRFWLSEPTISKQEREHLYFWQEHSPSKPRKERQLWIGAASLDTGLAFIRHNAQITHMINPDTNAERKLIVDHLQKTGEVKKTRSVTIGKPYQLRNRVWRGILRSDGKLTICELKPF